MFLRSFLQDGKFMKTLRIASIALLAAAFFAGTADAQKKTTKRPPAKKPVSTTKVVLPPLEVRAARAKVQTQFDNVNLFIAKFGPIAAAWATWAPSVA